MSHTRLTARKTARKTPSRGEPKGGCSRRWLSGILVAFLCGALEYPLFGQESTPLEPSPCGEFPLPEHAIARFGSTKMRLGGQAKVRFLQDERFLLAASFDGTLRLLDAMTGSEVHRFEGHVNPHKQRPSDDVITDLALSPDFQLAATASNDKSVKIWDLEKRALVRTLAGAAASVGSVTFANEGKWIACGCSDGSVLLWDAASGELLNRHERAHKSRVWCVAAPSQGDYIATAGADGRVRLWHPRTGLEKGFMETGDLIIFSLQFGPDDEALMASGVANKGGVDVPSKVFLWGVEKANLIWELDAGPSAVMSADGRFLAASAKEADDLVLRVWDVKERRQTKTKFASYVPPIHPAFSSTGGLLACTLNAGGSTDVQVWDAKTGKPRFDFERHTGTVRDARWSPTNENEAATASDDGTIRIWSVKDSRQLHKINVSDDPILSFDYLADGRHVVFSTHNDGGKAVVCEIATGKRVHEYSVGSGRILAIDVSPDGKFLAYGQRSSARRDEFGNVVEEIVVWDLVTQRLAHRIRTYEIQRIEFSRDGGVLGAAGGLKRSLRGPGKTSGHVYHPRIQLWKVGEWTLAQELGPSNQRMAVLAVSSDASLVFGVDRHEGLQIWDAAKAEPRNVTQLHTLFGATFSPDDRAIAVGLMDNSIAVLDARSCEELVRFKGHSGGACVLRFSNTRSLLLSAGFDGTPIVWDLSEILD